MNSPNMSPYQILDDLYSRKGLEFDYYVQCHLRCGFVFSTPEFFIMGRPVCRQWKKEDVFDPETAAPKSLADGWMIHAMAGDTGKAWSILPWPLGWIGFQRFDNVLRWVPTEVIRRFHPASTDEINAASVLSH